MNKPLILVVEDDSAVRNLIVTTLETQDYKYHTASKGSEAILEAVSQKPDVVLLDLGLPDMDGIDIIKKIRSWSNMPIIVISARSEDRDKIDYASGCVYLDGEELHLTPIEYKLVCLLAKNVGKVLTHKYIIQSVWGTPADNSEASLRVFMATLRKKLSDSSQALIQTHIGIGYRMMKL